MLRITDNNKLFLVVFLVAGILLISASVCSAAIRTASQSGNWSSTATWGGASVPTAADDVRINGNITVTVNIPNAQCASLTYLYSNNRTTTVTISGSNFLVIGGLLSMPYPNTGSTSILNVNAGTVTAGALTMGATVIGRNNEINITNGTLTVLGAITTGTSGCQIRFTGAGTLNMEGNFKGSPELTTIIGSTVNYSGSANQTIYAITYNGNLGISGTGTKLMVATTTVNGTLYLTSGILADSELASYTWKGTQNTSWMDQDNWNPVGTPSSESNVVIPDASTTSYDPTLPAVFEIKSLVIEAAGVLNSVDNAQLTINGDNEAWNNPGGTFNANTSNVIFTNPTATISGITNFYDITIPTGAALVLLNGSVTRIAGTLTINGTLNAVAGGINTVEYNGIAAQSINFPSATTFFNLAISNASGVTLSSSDLTTVLNDLTINSSMQFTMDPGNHLLVTGNIANYAGTSGFVLKSDATGTAALIHNTDNVPATVQRFISGNPEDWHFLSSPVSNQSISGSWLPSGTYGNGTGYDLYLWDENTSCWIYKLNTTSPVNWPALHPGANFEVSRGYLYSVQALNPTKEFSGYLNNGTLDYRLTTSSTDVGLKGFNLIGNPYPSSIDWQASTGWSRSKLVESGGGYDMWIWNPAASNYGVSNSFTGISTNGVTQHIAPMQGFFVHALSDGPLFMDNNLRTINGANSWLKSSSHNSSNISIRVTSGAGNGFDETIIGFGYSKNEDGATKLFSKVPSAPSLFMALGGKYFSVRYLTNTEEHSVVPLMFTPGANGDFTINCNFDSFNFETVMLEDRKMRNIQDMKADNTYGFKSSTSDAADRFVLHFGPVDNIPGNDFPARIYTDGHYLIVDLSLVINETETLVYDTMGRLLLSRKLQGKTLHRLNLNVSTQIIIISLKNSDGQLSQKHFWK